MALNKTELTDFVESLQNIKRKLTALDSALKSHSTVTYDTDDDHNFISWTTSPMPGSCCRVIGRRSEHVVR